ncbi:MAG: SLBB domain-containing protein [Verrucomicrobiota bacterium]
MKPAITLLLTISFLSSAEARILSGFGPRGGAIHQLPAGHSKHQNQRMLVDYQEVRQNRNGEVHVRTRSRLVKMDAEVAQQPPSQLEASNTGKGIFKKLMGSKSQRAIDAKEQMEARRVLRNSRPLDTTTTEERPRTPVRNLFANFSSGSSQSTPGASGQPDLRANSLSPSSSHTVRNFARTKTFTATPVYHFVQISTPQDLPYPLTYQARASLPPVSPARQYQETILPKDFLEIRFTDSAENSPFFSRSFEALRVGPLEVPNDGFLAIPYSPNVIATGKSITEFTREVSTKIQEVSPTAEVTVRRLDRLVKRAFVIGEVSSPGPVSIDRETFTLVDAIAGAGPTLPSHLNRFVLERNGESIPMTALQLYRQQPDAQDGDVIRVERDTSLSYFVLGAVQQPGSFEFPDLEPTLVEALSVGGGLVLSNANPEAVFVFRHEKDTDKVYGIDFSTPRGTFLAQKFVLAPNDIIYVSEAPLSKWQRVAEVVNSTAGTSLGIRNLTRTNRF